MLKRILGRTAVLLGTFGIVLLASCRTPEVLTPDKKDYPCGYHGVVCTADMGGGCCWEGWVCQIHDLCEYVATDGQLGYGVHKNETRPRVH